MFRLVARAHFIQIGFFVLLLCNFDLYYKQNIFLIFGKLNTLPKNKIYIDSRHKTASSVSDSDFEIQLKEPINLPEKRVCVVSDIILKNTLTTIEKFKKNMGVRGNNVNKVIKL